MSAQMELFCKQILLPLYEVEFMYWGGTTTTTCVYLDRQIALPIWGATHVFFLLFFYYYYFFFFYICISFSIFVILVDVFFSFLVSFSNMSFVVILVDGSLCIPGHVSRTCSCVSIFSGHFRHFVSLYLPLKLFFTSNILVLALNIIDASWRVNSLVNVPILKLITQWDQFIRV